MAAAFLAVLSWLMPLIGILSAAVIGLITLRQGPHEGLFTAFLASVASGVLGLFVVGSFTPAFGTLGLLWTPMWLVAMVLRVTRSLALAVQGALLFGVAVILAYFGISPDPVAEWRGILETFSQPLLESGVLNDTQRAGLIASVAPWMTGILAAVLYLQLIAALMLARWWQALLYNPGGFRREFHELRLDPRLAYATLLVLALAYATEMDGVGLLINHAVLLLMAAYLLQGLALVHGLVAQSGASPRWLVAMYVVLILTMPNLLGVLVAAGYADAWFDFRARLRAKGKGG
ncbi:MAG TPA: hypothetical protein ENI99_11550 [Sedimenticola sp.]|nr:hypothetical protein [Sedimenticola sp.]